MSITPFPFQLAGIDRLREHARNRLRYLVLVALMGAGKTVLSLEMMQQAYLKGKRSLFICDRRMLVHQAAAEAREYGLHAGIIMAGCGLDQSACVQFASRDTLDSWAIEGATIPLPEADLVFVDECHRANGVVWQRIKRQYPAAVFVGLTATPCDAEGNGLGGDWQALVQPIKPSELKSIGRIISTVRYFAPDVPDLKGLRCSGEEKDYAIRGLAARMSRQTLVGNAVGWWQKLADGRPSIYFCCNVAHAQAVTNSFLDAGITAAMIVATTPDEKRQQIEEDSRAGKIKIVVNCDVMTEGVNWPWLAVCGLLRPTKRFRRYLQMVGRVMRTHPGKSEALVIDHGGCALYHPFADADHDWSLDPDANVDVRNRERFARGEPMPVRCPQCMEVFLGQRTCPFCGTKLVTQIHPEHKKTLAGTLIEITNRGGQLDPEMAAIHEKGQQKFWYSCVGVAVKRMKSAGFAAFMFKKKYRREPWDAKVTPEMTREDLAYPAAHVFASFVDRGRRLV